MVEARSESRDAAVAPRDSRRAKIVAAARELFLAKGYGATSMDEVAHRARASKTTVYTRFASKQALFAAVLAARGDRAGMAYEPGEFDGRPAREALAELGERFVRMVGGPDALRIELIYLAEAASFPDLAEAYAREGPERAIAAVTAYLADARGCGLVDVADPRFAAIQFLVAVKGDPYGIDWGGAEPTPAQRRRRLEKVVALFLNGVAAKPRA